MKKIIVLFCLCMGIAQAEFFEKNETIPEFHQVTVTTTKNIDLSGSLKKDFVFFGTISDYSKFLDNLMKQSALSGASGALNGINGAGSGISNGIMNGGLQGVVGYAGIGAVMGITFAIIDNIKEDYKFIYIYDITNNNGQKTRKIVLFVANNFNDEFVIKQYLENKF